MAAHLERRPEEYSGEPIVIWGFGVEDFQPTKPYLRVVVDYPLTVGVTSATDVVVARVECPPEVIGVAANECGLARTHQGFGGRGLGCALKVWAATAAQRFGRTTGAGRFGWGHLIVFSHLGS